ncbi:MAG TPA: hypothetical protein DC057_01365 [Spirochaetia bacterium]|nr:hypothetical protein [Spirochaetia bacterium]
MAITTTISDKAGERSVAMTSAKKLLTVLGGTGLISKILSWQSSTLVHVGGVASSDFTGTGGGGAAANFTILIPAYCVFQNSIIRSVTVNAVAVSGVVPWKLKIFRWFNTDSVFTFVRESTFMPLATGTSTIVLDTPLECAPGDVLAVYCPADNNIYWRPGTRSLKVRYKEGDTTITDAFETFSSTIMAVEIDVLGYKPYIALLGDSIMEGSGNGTTHWYGLFDSSFPAEIKTTPGGNNTSDPGSVIRSLIGIGSQLQYQNLSLGSTAWQRTAESGAALCAAIKPKKVFILTGTNDVGTLTWEQVDAYMDTTLGIFNAAGVKVYICEILPRTGYTDEQAAIIRTWNANYATWCSANNAILVPTHDVMGQVRGSTGEIDDLLATYDLDGVHLTQAGVAKLASIISGYI